MQLGRLHMQQKTFSQAVTALQKAVQLQPEDAKIHLLLGRAYQKTGQGEKAVQFIREACELEPSNVESKISLAKAYLDEDDFDNARTLLTEMTMGKGKLATVHRLLGDLWVKQKSFHKAVDEYKASLLHAKQLVEKHPELLDIEQSSDNSFELAQAYQKAFSSIITEQDQAKA